MPTSPTTSPVPPPVFMPQISNASSAPTPTPIPMFPSEGKPASKLTKDDKSIESTNFSLPKLRLEIRDLNHAGSQTFLTAVIANEALQTAVRSVLALLYESPHCPITTIPTTRSVTLILRPMEGVAYTTGSDLDDDHKEIHFSLDYIHTAIGSERKKHEIMGVLTHEMVHCYQYNGFHTCPGGLIEGIADWVRLNAHLSPPHWKKESGGKWDAGYQHTGYFLEYLERRFGQGTIRKLNEKLRIERYEEKRFWTELCGRPVEQLWKDYSEYLEVEKRKAEEEECVIVEREDATTPKQVGSGGDGATSTAVTKETNYNSPRSESS
ncbi:plant Basic Secretory protein [Sclerotinia borealis F-4128]|uniref:Plant Basic Secretory protein n=1 Tax=Sclerotinia borealis (strain F-4128) TaxID=1432307 RepID=W9CVQ3_SCLBF|nr:plant Basic Secretory protein [Sclerotinia borealis F-4128]